MRTAKLSLLAAALILSTAARADRLPIPPDAPPSFKTECGSCHLPFPPALLMAPDWKRVMSTLDKHYGDNASLDGKTRRELEDFLVRNASNRSRMAGAGDPPRLTASTWFRREHRQVPQALWRDARVNSASNCTACHSRAEQGSYRGREIALPELRDKH
ncbi:MAG: cytochrome C [Denitratisoma sp.]|nr:cytochrome C [Denitratisoma sp.]